MVSSALPDHKYLLLNFMAQLSTPEHISFITPNLEINDYDKANLNENNGYEHPLFYINDTDITE